MGHKLPGQDVSYVRATTEDRLMEYMKAVDLLTIDSKHRLKTRITELETERDKTMEKYHEEWLLQLKKDYALMSRAEFGELETIIEALKKYIPDVEFKVGPLSVNIIDDDKERERESI